MKLQALLAAFAPAAAVCAAAIPQPGFVVAADQRSGGVVAFDARTAEAAVQYAWEWSAAKDAGVPAELRERFGTPNDCRMAKDESGADAVLVFGANGGFARVNVARAAADFAGCVNRCSVRKTMVAMSAMKMASRISRDGAGNVFRRARWPASSGRG